MKKTLTLLSLILVASLALSACAQITSASEGTPTPQPPVSTPTQPLPIPSATPGTTSGGGDILTVTLDDQGKTIHMAVDQSFLLKLGENYNWDIQVADQTIISRVKNIMVIRGAQGVYDALAAGTTTLTATGDPLCRQSKPPCMMPSILFSVTIEVK